MNCNYHLKCALFTLFMLIPVFAIAGTAAEESRDPSLAEKKKLLDRLYKAVPESRDALRQSGGFATFKNMGTDAKSRRRGQLSSGRFGRTFS